MTRSRQSELRERITILGDVNSASFVPWIRRHADKLGLSQDFLYAGAERIELEVAGPVELIDMLEMGCSLGPIDVWVDEIQRRVVDPISTPKSERHLT
ncbi:acylphosphatase [Rhizobium lentis]|uniref:Acylphosphatase n=1 Tax=Rhizobium lentis TaxID=1138194 RepID=A0A9Q3MAS3_9HYPH|nr:acylphosphatase [Rhizobium lentis]MBX4956764.1 acylphosphatase [Rhizobium lentis]MBX4975547.1 acylphosphatase [Rhizobium lentis]MBX4986461.1 acylphosphatase [Rhizobium lentis]MBX4999282.1 acylphosphatase [Rhizobium lentis]MBX5004905.1 acylphosphatase [Rhizobium lentis]